MSAPEPTHPLSAIAMPGLHGAAGDQPMRVSLPRRDIVQVMVRRAGDAAFAVAMMQTFGMTPPAAGHATTGATTTAIWVQPGAYMLTASEPGLADRAAAAFAGLAAVEDQGHGRTTMTVSGPAARDMLSRGCRIDLHPRVFGPGRAASTTIAQIGCLIHQTNDAPSFDLTVFSTLAEPFFHWLLEAGAGPGLVIT